jgi:imidazolonepropionase-like amidohydrolase
MFAIVNAEIHTCGPQGVLGQGTVLVEDGKVVAVGERLSPPGQAEVVDAQGLILTPGFVDAHTHLGIPWQELAGESDTNESTSAVNPHLRAIDAVDLKDLAFQDALQGGVTTAAIHPGNITLALWKQGLSPIAGQSVVMKTRGGVTGREVLRQPAGLKLALGDDVARLLKSRQTGPNSRMGIVALLRQLLDDAQRYRQAGHEPRNLQLEAVAQLLDGQIPAHIHARRAPDILAALRLADDYGLSIVLHHVTEGHLIVDELAASGVPCVVGPITSARQAGGESEHLSQRTPGILAAAGILVALMTDHPAEPIQFLPIIAGQAVREGLPHQQALEAITITAARILGVADRVGSIEPGKDADLILHDGDPLEAMTRIRLVVADGLVVADALNQERKAH